MQNNIDADISKKNIIAVIGGGVSGITAALTAFDSGAEVCIIEPADRLGKKILVTGNGKCNLTNQKISADKYRTSNENNITDIIQVINGFNNDNLVEYMRNLGVPARERDGYVYPYSEQAQTVYNALNNAVRRNNILVYQCYVKDINKKDKFFLELSNGTSIIADNVIIATGSKAGVKKEYPNNGYDLAKKTGHKIITPLPALTALICKDDFVKSISGVRAKCSVSVFDKTEYGELQFTDYGISGIPVFQLSRYVVKHIFEHKNSPEVTIKIDFMPEISQAELSAYIKKLVLTSSGYFTSTVDGLLNNKIMLLLFRIMGIENNTRNSDIDLVHIEKLACLIKNFIVTATDYRSFDFAQVSQGGVALSEINMDTLESLHMKGLYFCGEVLDVDGMCGGYNLQWAFSSGHLAGKSASELVICTSKKI